MFLLRPRAHSGAYLLFKPYVRFRDPI